MKAEGKVITKEKEKPSISEIDGRNKKGRFVKGNSCSIGNLSNTNQASVQLKRAFVGAVTIEDIQKIALVLVKKAMKGDVAAIKELFDRCLGKPLQQHQMDVEVKTYTAEEYDSIRAMLARRCVNSRMLNVQEQGQAERG